jgi:hypothetical protein
VLIGSGGALVAVAVCCFLQSRRARHRSAFLASAQLLTCAEVACAAPGRVAVAAATGTEPRLSAPVTGRNCVWYRVAINLHLGEEGLGPVKHRHQTAAGGIYLQDATGKVPLTRELATRTLTQRGDSPISTTTGFPNSSAARRYVKDLWWSRKIGPQYGLLAPSETRFSYELTEEILPPGAHVFVIGTIRPGEGDGHILDRADRHDGATTLSRHEAVGQLAAHARRWSAWALPLAAAGLAIILAGILLTS